MVIDFFLGIILGVIALVLGLSYWQALLVFFAALCLDGDIVLNEAVRKFIKKDKEKFLSLDEFSYTHKFLLHLPLVVLPTVFILGFLWEGILLGSLLFLVMFGHLIHDSIDKNFDGVRWLWPINSLSYKWRQSKGRIVMEKRSAQELLNEAKEKKERGTGKILRDNIIL